MGKSKKFVLGPIQELWLSQLEKYPERQTSGTLGYGTSKKYSACCLGEGLLCIARHNKKKFPFIDKQIVDRVDEGILSYSFKKLGLHDDVGRFRYVNGKPRNYSFKGINHPCLTEMNDEGVSWTDIAKIIRKNPRMVFNKSV